MSDAPLPLLDPPPDPLLDPRDGDLADDASSTYRRSLLAIAGSLLAEISLPKLLLALLLSVALPAVLLGLSPLVASAAYGLFAPRVASGLTGVVPAVLLLFALAVAWVGGRVLWRAAERSFWALNSVAVQPAYLLCREGVHHLAGRLLPPVAGGGGRTRVRAGSAVAAAVLLGGVGLVAAAAAWPSSRWAGDAADLIRPQRLIVPALANAAVVTGLYLAAAAAGWGIADAASPQPHDLDGFDVPPDGARAWRVAHLSDLHTVGGPYEFRLESGRAGPRGNDRVAATLARVAAAHAADPLDLVLVTGDMTDAGRSTEWVAFLAALAAHPELAARTLILPGNHDLNIVDRANPARLELPGSAGRRLRQMRTLSAMAAVQGDRVRVLDRGTNRPGPTLTEALEPHRAAIRQFADSGAVRLSARLGRVWDDAFPMVSPPAGPEGMGVLLLDSNAASHFSFTNALGLVDAVAARAVLAVARHYPAARWVVAVHHHLVEYPRPAATLSERVGTALVNGTWFVRRLRPLGGRVVAMHGHRHVDWVGQCGPTRIVSAPSPVMAPAGGPAGFHVHTLVAGPGGGLLLAEPQWQAVT